MKLYRNKLFGGALFASLLFAGPKSIGVNVVLTEGQSRGASVQSTPSVPKLEEVSLDVSSTLLFLSSGHLNVEEKFPLRSIAADVSSGYLGLHIGFVDSSITLVSIVRDVSSNILRDEPGLIGGQYVLSPEYTKKMKVRNNAVVEAVSMSEGFISPVSSKVESDKDSQKDVLSLLRFLLRDSIE